MHKVMLASQAFEAWDGPLETLQDRRNLPNMRSLLDSYKQAGYSVADFHYCTADQKQPTLSRIYKFTELPATWPLILFNDLAAQLPPDWSDTLRTLEVAVVPLQDITAAVWPHYGQIAIPMGLSNFFLTALGGHFKTGHRGSLQNRPTDQHPGRNFFTLPAGYLQGQFDPVRHSAK